MAVLKYISQNTSYHNVWLAFHSYSQVIQILYNGYWFGPPSFFTKISTCSWIDHIASGQYKLYLRPLQTRFHYAFSFFMLATFIYSLAHDAKGTPWLLFRVYDRLLNILFQVLFHSPFRRSFHFSLTVLFTIGYLFIFRLADGSAYVLLTKGVLSFFFFLLYGTITLFGYFFQNLLTFKKNI